MNTKMKRSLSLACALLMFVPSLQAQTWQWASPTLNGSIGVKTVDGMSTQTATQNPTGAVAKTNQTAVTAAPVMVVQATAQLPVVTEGAACSTPTDQYGTKADLSIMYGCRGGVWTKLDLIPKVVTAGTACPIPGQIGQDATGSILSCQSGVWKALGSADGLGYGQTWQYVTRNAGQTYVNNTGKPILFHMAFASGASSNEYVLLTVNGVQFYFIMAVLVSGVVFGENTAVIPVGASYSWTLALGNNVGKLIAELR